MEKFILNPSNYTPLVNFNNESGVLEITGTSTPEDSYNFFQPLVNWIELYTKSPALHTQLVFKMEYFNTSSTVFMLRIIKGVSKLSLEGKNVSIFWYHQDDDEDLIEAGKDFAILAKTPIKLMLYQK